ncbi:Gas vesicle protein K [Micromonospora echinaurantiaca]|uniref:Gas vesicle protein K n=1 Tax=Micromonospora echinaurantiaca TaxID=47857 RepID=A0A1C5K3E4_9ACTN|nr:gas vesicle protein K [Micromonospora echinaurantiaca]SCG77278.1 Gas vesicle protein K [Micromonospora echinaurantiaca]
MTGGPDAGRRDPARPARSARPGLDEAAELAAALGEPQPWQQPRVTPLDRRLAVDRDSVERGLASLVLTVIELLRQLVERQALRRVDLGDLSEEQVERIGVTLMALEEQMAGLREYFGLAPEDLNLDLGPLGPLLPTD